MADRNFDEEFDYEHAEGHTFTLGGYQFRTLAVAPPGAYLQTGRGIVPGVLFLRRVVVPEDRANLERVLEMTDTSAKIIDAAPALFRAAVALLSAERIDDAQARKEALETLQGAVDEAKGSEEEGPVVSISAHELDVVAQWLMEVTLGRPTNSPSQSSNGAGRTSSSSRAASSKAAKVGKA